MAEGFELADELMFTGVGSVDAAGEVVRTEVVVGGGLGENVPDDHDQGVGRGHGGLPSALHAEPAVEPAELGAEVGAGAPRGPGPFGEALVEFLVSLAGLARTVPPGGLVVARAQAGPRSQVRRSTSAWARNRTHLQPFRTA